MANDAFLKACRREKAGFTPVWLMRQAGRYMKEYMVIREKHSFLEMCRTPELACEVTLQPIRAFDLDAAIIFADILLPLEGMGIGLEFAKNEGPVISNPVRTRKDIDAVRIINPEEHVPYLLKAIKMVRAELAGKVPLIGFSGAPFTLASYIIEGEGSKNYINTKKLIYSDLEGWKVLMDKITEVIIVYLEAQIDAGAQVVQLFDSWVGCLGPDDFKNYALPYTKKIIDRVSKKGVPIINFGTGTGAYLDLVAQGGGDVIGVDWKVRLDEAWQTIGHDKGIQGNLDPVVLFGPASEIRKRVKEIIDMAGGRPGHIFNLGHGIILGTPVDNVRAVVDSVHEFSGK
ncbi:MAG TPA: uroporphyrinogen decarboxylase [Deltaproteobacteria bacterium]|nr:MAG: uroporphyrinogen decarboxylase [Deltaproteobacteria bacterium GWA2_55_82]OGQ64837.1 MAG: uroporphyrinogen decarboxylase [Deltaproteobacteria bacterium RIFCSPLOWO2_02_FULL_55_12]OIJ73904.1 MAG: uroporphyrinogen decarboxylase [Deltaproteobacteria bacterium GWC2_55_46]HBG47358.1 uroporphyrinogen decarboxylase [Deltaproteobacteria bacterium]HCY09897.1 uroporphyrinogen decarboxylase [Deltaproteobacteria bacterium]